MLELNLKRMVDFGLCLNSIETSLNDNATFMNALTKEVKKK
jgi:hypothetical protein